MDEEIVLRDEGRDLISNLFYAYKKKKEENKLYSIDDGTPKLIIHKYLKLVTKPSFNSIINLYKKNYITCESKVEPNFTPEEQQGLSDVYDYIQSFDFKTQTFNIFTTSLIIHNKLYKHCGDGTFGGQLRDSDAVLQGLNIEVPPAVEAKKIFNNYIPKRDSILDKYRKGDIFGYIEDCIRLNVELIKLQPFADGNKRTFRALTNLLFKVLNIPPIYIPKKERDEYKEVLVKAMRDNDYDDIIQFYYYKICDAIMNLDIEHSVIKNEEEVEKVKSL